MQVITSCNSTKEELCQEFCHSIRDSQGSASEHDDAQQQGTTQRQQLFQYVDHVKTHPKFKFAGVEGTKVCTVAFRKLL